MASRILKRPMFRRGGMANQGIMSGLEDRSGYQEGGNIQEDSRNFFEKMIGVPENFDNMTRAEAEKFLYPNTLSGGSKRLFTNTNDLLYNYGVRPLANLGAYITGIGDEGINTFDKIDTIERQVDNFSGTVRDDQGNIVSTNVKPDPDADPDADDDDSETEGKEGKGKGTGGTGDLSEADLKTVYADLLPMFKETLGVDDEDYKKDAYLQLARFGTNLMAQPGGSLTASIGRAAEKPLEGVADIIGAKRAAERRPKELALQAALRETEPGQIGKSVRDLMKLGYSKEEAIKEVVEGRGGDATKQATRARIISEDAESILSGNLVSDGFQARKIAKQMDKYGVEFGEIVGKLPDDKTELIEGGIYIDKGIMKRHRKGVFYKVTEKGFSQAPKSKK
jgi:hypothetical protein